MKRMQRVFNDSDALRCVDGGLDANRKAAYLAYLADHPDEAERLAIWSRQSETLRALYAAVAAEPVPPALRLGQVLPRNLDSGSPPGRGAIPLRPTVVAEATVLPGPAPEASGPAPRGRFQWPMSVAILLGAALLIAAAGQVLLSTAGRWSREAAAPAPVTVAVASLADRAADAYRTYALDPVRPVEFSATQTGLLTHWARRRIGIAVEPPDFTAEGWTLLGGRYVPATEMPGVFYVYEDASGDRIAVLADRATGPGKVAPILQAHFPGLSTMTWSDGVLAYAITAGRQLDWLARNGEALRARVPRPKRD